MNTSVNYSANYSAGCFASRKKQLRQAKAAEAIADLLLEAGLLIILRDRLMAYSQRAP